MLTLPSFREEVIWLAGILEGEGTFGQGTHHGMFLGLGMTDLDVVARAHRLIGHSSQIITTHRPPYKPIHRFTVTGPLAAGWMMMLFPFLGERRQAKVRTVLAVWRAREIWPTHRTVCPRGHPLLDRGFRRARRGRAGRYRYRVCPECIRLRYVPRAWHVSPNQLALL